MTKPNQPDKFSGIFVPRRVLEDSRLSNTDRILFGMLDGLDNADRGCFGSNAYLAGRLGVQQRTLQQGLTRLEKLGYVLRGYNQGRRTIKTVTAKALEGVQKNAGGMQNTSGEGCKIPHTDIKGDTKDSDNPPSPLARGAKVRRRAFKLKPEDYSRGF